MRPLAWIFLSSLAAAPLVFIACGSRTDLNIATEIDAGYDATLDARPDTLNDVALDIPFEASRDAEDAGDAIDAPIDVAIGTCTPRDCKDGGYACGQNGDGCGNLIQCGQCPTPQICGVGGYSQCGGGWGLGPDGGPICVARTCKDLGFDCGWTGDGCGNSIFCGTCQSPQVCGAAGNPGRCGSACTGLCQQQVQCDSGTTSISGTVVAGTLPKYGNPDPVYGALVYVPNAAVKAFTPGVSCNQCGGDVSGNPLVETKTAPDGTFKLDDVPVGTNIPLVIQLGRWRRQVTVSSVAACQDNPIDTTLTHLPRNHSEGDIPLMAIATGCADPIECVLLKMGIDQNEFTQPSGSGRVRMYMSTGVNDGPNTPPASQLWSAQSTLSQYDAVVLPCEGQELTKTSSAQNNVIQYANTGGRVFTTHYSYTWLFNDPPFSGTANWNVNANFFNTLTANIDTSFQKGKDFATWLGNVGALSGPNQISLTNPRQDVISVVPPSEQFVYATSPSNMTLYYDFFTPVKASPSCGRVIFSDFHVVNGATCPNNNFTQFPQECDTSPMTAQEKALEFMLFDLAQCVPSPPPICVPETCASQKMNCGSAGDGCGNQIPSCGVCTPPQSCGGGGGINQCGYPDAGTCQPKTCAQQGFNCGSAGDGCGTPIQCGSCALPEVCGGGGKPNVCGR